MQSIVVFKMTLFFRVFNDLYHRWVVLAEALVYMNQSSKPVGGCKLLCWQRVWCTFA